MISVDLSNVESIESSNHLYQWDKGQQLEIKGLGVSKAPEIHFGVNGSMLAIVVNSTLSGGIVYADIPNEILMSGKDLRVYVHIDGTTIKNILIPVFKRNMPENYVIDNGNVTWIEEFETEANEITTAKLTEIEAKGTSTLETIPDDYTALQETVADLKSELNKINSEYEMAYNGYGKSETWDMYTGLESMYKIADITKGKVITEVQSEHATYIVFVKNENTVVHTVKILDGKTNLNYEVDDDYEVYITNSFEFAINTGSLTKTKKLPRSGWTITGEPVLDTEIFIRFSMYIKTVNEIDNVDEHNENIGLIYDGEIYNTTSSYSGSEYYGIEKIEKGTKIKDVSIKSAETCKFVIAHISNGNLVEDKVVIYPASNRGYTKHIINHTVEYDDSYIFLSGSFYYSTERIRKPLYNVESGIIKNQRASIDASIKIYVENEKTKAYDYGAYFDERTISKDYPDATTSNAYSNFNIFYECFRLNKGVKIKDISLLAPTYNPKMIIGHFSGGVFNVDNEIELNLTDGENYVTTDVDYVINYDTSLVMLNAFYYQVGNEGYLPNIYTKSTNSISAGTAPLDCSAKITLSNRIMDINNNSIGVPFSCISMFENMGCCGDSYTAGMIALSNPNREIANENLSWGKVLGRAYGIDVSIFAKGGMTAKTWYSDSSCLAKLLSESPKQLYTISLGHNEAYLNYTIGTIDDLNEDYTTNPDTFYGNYSKIIERIKDYAPNAFIILLRQSRPYANMNNGHQINDAISALGVHYGLPVFDPETDEYLSSDEFQKNMSRSHPVYSGYAGMAEAFARSFARYASGEYYDYFAQYGVTE